MATTVAVKDQLICNDCGITGVRGNNINRHKGGDMPDKSLFSKVDHIGVVVRDIDKAVEYYESLGIGPFEPVNAASP